MLFLVVTDVRVNWWVFLHGWLWVAWSQWVKEATEVITVTSSYNEIVQLQKISILPQRRNWNFLGGRWAGR